MTELHVRVPAGTYFVGDPCYAIPVEKWIVWLEDSLYATEPYVLDGTVEGHRAVGVSTFHGDGHYSDNRGNRYSVDSGLLGVVPEALWTGTKDREELERFGSIVTFDEAFYIVSRVETGLVTIGEIEIATGEDGE